MIDRRGFLKTSVRSLAGGAMMLVLPERAVRAGRSGTEYLERAVFAMGTTVSISLFGRDRKQMIAATSAAFEELYRLERLLSVYLPESDIGRINASSGRREVHISADTWTVLSRGKEFCRVSDGAFDLTVEPLLERFGFRERAVRHEHTGTPPVIGDKHLTLGSDGTAVIDDERVRVDTGGIAVGYAVDRMARVLKGHGIETALINHGGDILALGTPEDSDGWSVVVPHPTRPAEDLLKLSLKDRALSTSTNTRSTQEFAGRRYGHIFDPRTGDNPAACMSMSVVAASSCEADALSTALFVTGDTTITEGRGCDFIALYPEERFDTSLR